MGTTSGLRNITFDDRDTTNFHFHGQWTLNGSWKASNGMSGTLSSTNDPHANVTFTFPQSAVAFYYYGIRRSRGGLYGICIDSCDPTSGAFQPINALNITDDGKNPPVVLFSHVFESAGVHEIILRNQDDTRFNGNSQLTLDRFDLEVMDNGTAGPVSFTLVSSPSRPPRTSELASSSAYNVKAISTASPTLLSSPALSKALYPYPSSLMGLSTPSPYSILPPNPTTSNSIKIKNSSSSSTPIAGIVGGVVGALAVILFIFLLCFWLRIRRMKALARLKAQRNRIYAKYYPCDISQADSSQLAEDLPYSESLMKDSASTLSDSVVSVSEGYGVGIGKGVDLKRHMYADE